MSQLLKINQVDEFEYMYETYGSSLYGIILKICPDVEEAQEILIESFRVFFHQNLNIQYNDRVFPQLLQITIQVASEKTNRTKQTLARIILNDLKQLA